MALLSMNSEGAVLDWAALYLRQELGSDIATAGFAFGALRRRHGADALPRRRRAQPLRRGRHLAHLEPRRGRRHAGRRPVRRSPWLAIAAFAFCGLGIANMVPILFSAAGNQPGVSPGAGMSVVTTMGYSGILVAPSAIGFVGERTGFAPVFIAIAVLLVLVFLMSGLTRTADFSAGQPGSAACRI